MKDKGHSHENHPAKLQRGSLDANNFVLDKGIFSNVFEKDIRRVYVYKKVERLAKAIHLIAPAFMGSASLKDRLDRVAVSLIDAAILAPSASRVALCRELLALSSILSIARSGGVLSPMNADVIVQEAHFLLQDVAGYEEPRLMLEDVTSLASLSKSAAASGEARDTAKLRSVARVTFDTALTSDQTESSKGHNKGQISDRPTSRGRRDAIVAVLESKGPSYIKDISTVIREVSEKTIQRELSALVSDGTIIRKGDRRWTTYELA